jgi:tetratricopeptide (TPR) repeat protein
MNLRRKKITNKSTSDQQKSGEKPQVLQKVSGWKLCLFRITAVIIIPVLLLLFAEIVLRITGFGYYPHALIKCKLNGKEAYCDNPTFTRLFFPANLIGQSNPLVFYANKPDNTYRIFVLGSSVAKGSPEPMYNFGRILEAMLNNKYPQTNFEVINTGKTAINSHVILPIAKDCARHQPDLFVLYMGNNEVVGPYGAGTVFAPVSPSLTTIRTSIAIKSTKIGQLLETLLSSITAKQTGSMYWEGMDMFLKKQVRFNDPALEYVYNHFEQNLTDICDTCLKSRAKVILCNLSSNLKNCPPFASLHKPNLSDTEKQKWDTIYEQGVNHETIGNYTEAIKYYLEAAKIDDTYADLQFRLGRCYWAIGQFDLARDRYIQARQFDTLRFRSDIRINNIIQKAAQNKAKDGVYFADIIKTFEQNSPNETPGKELFYEHVHPRFKGNYLLARTVLEQIEKVLPEQIKNNSNHPVMNEQECIERLVYTGWDQYGILNNVLFGFFKKPPFTNQLYHDEQVKELEQEIESLKVYASPSGLKTIADQYQRATQQYPSDVLLMWRYAQLLDIGLKNPPAAAKQFQNILEHFPYYYQARIGLAFALYEQGKLDEAVAVLQECLKIFPSYNVYSSLGKVLYAKKDYKGAVKYFSKSLAYHPEPHLETHLHYARALYNYGDYKKAKQVLRNAIATFPKDQTVPYYYTLGIILEREGKTDEAISNLRTAIEVHPDPNSRDCLMLKKQLDELIKKRNLNL